MADIHRFPSRPGRPSTREDRIAAAAADLLGVLSRHPLDMPESVAVIAVLMGELSRRTGMDPGVMAFAATSTIYVDGIQP